MISLLIAPSSTGLAAFNAGLKALVAWQQHGRTHQVGRVGQMTSHCLPKPLKAQSWQVGLELLEMFLEVDVVGLFGGHRIHIWPPILIHSRIQTSS